MRFSLVLVAATACLVNVAHGQALSKLGSKIKAAAQNIAAAAAESPVGAGSGYLGASVDNTPELGQGVAVQLVRPGSPADASGLKAGDVITAIDDKPCRSLDDLDAVLGKSFAGTKLKLSVLRAGKAETVNLTLGTRPGAPATDNPPALAPPVLSPPAAIDTVPPPATLPPTLTPPGITPPPAGTPPSLDLPPPAATDPIPAPLDPPAAVDPTIPAGRASMGISVLPITDELRTRYGIGLTTRGAVIVGLRAGGPAETAGLPLGGVITHVNGNRVTNADELIAFISAMRPGQEVEIRYLQEDRLSTKTLRLGAASAVGLGPSSPSLELPAPPATPPAGSGDRPLLRRFEDLVDPGVTDPQTPIGSTILDPSAIKLLFERVKQLEAKVKALEAKVGIEPDAGAGPAIP
ncbi:MAG: PDZ domain-containing protein [Pirellulaceae bacterium]|nr:PDZ domain-containing protein [Pirellulaceae bacterium]